MREASAQHGNQQATPESWLVDQGPFPLCPSGDIRRARIKLSLPSMQLPFRTSALAMPSNYDTTFSSSSSSSSSPESPVHLRALLTRRSRRLVLVSLRSRVYSHLCLDEQSVGPSPRLTASRVVTAVPPSARPTRTARGSASHPRTRTQHVDGQRMKTSPTNPTTSTMSYSGRSRPRLRLRDEPSPRW